MTNQGRRQRAVVLAAALVGTVASGSRRSRDLGRRAMRGHGRRRTVSRALGSAVIAVCLIAAGASMVPVSAFVTGSLPNGFGAIVVDPSHSHVFVSSPTSNTITVLDFSGKIVQTVTGEAGPDSMVVTGNTLYVALRNGGAIDVFDTSTLLRTGTLGAGRLVQPGPLVL